MNYMNKILHLFDYNQKIKFLILIFIMIIASFLELLGLGMVIIVLNSFLGTSFKFALVIVPKIPSDPQNIFQSFGPKLSFFNLL